MNIFDKDVLFELGFEFQNDLGYLELKDGIEIWFKDNNFYLAGCDCPNINHASKVYLEDIGDLENLYRLFAGEDLKINI